MTHQELRDAITAYQTADYTAVSAGDAINRLFEAAWSWLAANPADNDEPVTANRVARFGVKLSGGDADGYQFADLRTDWSVMGTVNGSHITLSLMFREDGTLAGCDIESTVYGDDGQKDVTGCEFIMPLPETMGQFRRLCAALGIPLKEPG